MDRQSSVKAHIHDTITCTMSSEQIYKLKI